MFDRADRLPGFASHRIEGAPIEADHTVAQHTLRATLERLRPVLSPTTP